MVWGSFSWYPRPVFGAPHANWPLHHLTLERWVTPTGCCCWCEGSISFSDQSRPGPNCGAGHYHENLLEQKVKICIEFSGGFQGWSILPFWIGWRCGWSDWTLLMCSLKYLSMSSSSSSSSSSLSELSFSLLVPRLVSSITNQVCYKGKFHSTFSKSASLALLDTSCLGFLWGIKTSFPDHLVTM